jgi:hypothetical protein
VGIGSAGRWTKGLREAKTVPAKDRRRIMRESGSNQQRRAGRTRGGEVRNRGGGRRCLPGRADQSGMAMDAGLTRLD